MLFCLNLWKEKLRIFSASFRKVLMVKANEPTEFYIILEVIIVIDLGGLVNSEPAKSTGRIWGQKWVSGVADVSRQLSTCLRASPPGARDRALVLQPHTTYRSPFTFQTEGDPSELSKTKSCCWAREWTGVVEHEYSRPRVTAP